MFDLFSKLLLCIAFLTIVLITPLKSLSDYLHGHNDFFYSSDWAISSPASKPEITIGRHEDLTVHWFADLRFLGAIIAICLGLCLFRLLFRQR